MEYIVQGYYSAQYGWEDLTAHDNREDAERSLREYDENEGIYRHRIKVSD